MYLGLNNNVKDGKMPDWITQGATPHPVVIFITKSRCLHNYISGACTMEQNMLFLVISLVTSMALLLLLINRRQQATINRLQQVFEQQVSTNDHLNRITTELRRSTRMLALLANVELEMQPEGSNADGLDVQEAKLYIGNIDYSTTEKELERIFAAYGEIANVNIPTDRYNGKARGFGFVTFRTTAEALRAMELNGSEVKGRTIQVNFAKERDGARNMQRAG